MIIIAEIEDTALDQVLAALLPLTPASKIKVLAEVSPPAPPESDDRLETLARRVVELVRPVPDSDLQRETLRKVLSRHDTFFDQHGEADPALRNAVGHLSRKLKKLFQYEKPVSAIAVPRKTFFPNGDYMGTTYDVTPLGERVRAILLKEGAI